MAYRERTCVHCGAVYQPSRSSQKYCTTKCYGHAITGPAHYGWKGETFSQGRWFVSVNGKSILRARVVMEQKLGRPLLRSEVVHHKNGDKADDRPENLELKQTQAQHMKEHAKTFRSETHKECTRCHQIKTRSLFDGGHKKRQGGDPHHPQCKECRAAYYAQRWKLGLTAAQKK